MRPTLLPWLDRKRDSSQGNVGLSRIVAPGRAFNVIVDRRRHRADVAVLRVEAGEAIEAPAAAEVVLHCLSGHLAVAGELLAAGDSVHGHGPGTPGAAAEDSVVIVVGIDRIS